MIASTARVEKGEKSQEIQNNSNWSEDLTVAEDSCGPIGKAQIDLTRGDKSGPYTVNEISDGPYFEDFPPGF